MQLEKEQFLNTLQSEWQTGALRMAATSAGKAEVGDSRMEMHEPSGHGPGCQNPVGKWGIVPSSGIPAHRRENWKFRAQAEGCMRINTHSSHRI